MALQWYVSFYVGSIPLADTVLQAQTSALVSFPAAEVFTRMEEIQSVLREMLQLATTTKINCLISPEISATAVETALSIINRGFSKLFLLRSKIRALPKTQHFPQFKK